MFLSLWGWKSRFHCKLPCLWLLKFTLGKVPTCVHAPSIHVVSDTIFVVWFELKRGWPVDRSIRTKKALSRIVQIRLWIRL